MPISRRQFLGGSAALAATAAAVSSISTEFALSSSTSSAAAAPSLPVIALNRIAYGPRPGDVANVQSVGLQAYVDQQLEPGALNDADCDARIAARNLTTLNLSLTDLWTQYHALEDYSARLQPFREVRTATWLRAVYSKRQLQEVLVEFWHNHFNVSASSSSDIACVWPEYDRVIRRNCLGNFRTFLEAVAQSPSMLFYLDNASSRDGPANENYARELFELHTLGADHYYNSLYDNVDQIPRYSDGRPMGYIDQDVYEAADCFTGWTVANGGWNGVNNFPNTGVFLYHHDWHDRSPTKIVLSPNGRPNITDPTTPLGDGRRVLDLLATHPATAQHLCRKLCRRLVADEPPQTLVDKAVATWSANLTAPDQIKRVVRTIVLAPEFAAVWGGKVKRPFELVVSFLRATAAEFVPNENLHWTMLGTGYRLFEWPTPTGHPDTASAWLNSNVLQRLWNYPNVLMATWFDAARFNLSAQIPANVTTSTQIVDFWLGRLLGRDIAAADRSRLIDFMRQSRAADQPPVPEPSSSTTDLNDRINNLVTLIAMMPEFLQR